MMSMNIVVNIVVNIEQTKDSLGRMETACLCNCKPFEPSRRKNRTEVEIDLISREIVFFCYCWVNANPSYWLKEIVLCSPIGFFQGHFQLAIVIQRNTSIWTTIPLIWYGILIHFCSLSSFSLLFCHIHSIDLGMCKRIHITESANRSPFCDAWAVARSITFATAQTFIIRTPEFGRLRNLQFVEQFSKYDGIKWRRSLNSHTHTHTLFLHKCIRHYDRAHAHAELSNCKMQIIAVIDIQYTIHIYRHYIMNQYFKMLNCLRNSYQTWVKENTNGKFQIIIKKWLHKTKWKEINEYIKFVFYNHNSIQYYIWYILI